MCETPEQTRCVMPPSESGHIGSSGSGTLLTVGVGSVTPSACYLTGSWISDARGRAVTVVSTSSTNDDGTGMYYCAFQGTGHLKMVQFELSISPSGELSAKALDAGYVSGGDHGEAASERLFGDSTKVAVAGSASAAAYGIEKIAYYVSAAPPSPPAAPPALPPAPFAPPVAPPCLTQQGCAETARALGLSLGGGGLAFASEFTSKGCYSYSSGPYAGMAFFGTGGSDEEMVASVASQISAQGASMSSEHGSGLYGASNCIDGSTSNFCHSVADSTEPWLSIDLGSATSVESVVVYNRVSCCQGRLSPFEVFVGSAAGDTSGAQCGDGAQTVAATVGPFTISCGGAVGSHVTVRLSGSERTLNIAEVQVLGGPKQRLWCASPDGFLKVADDAKCPYSSTR